MSLYVIGDLHLSLTTEKPMDIFGEKWQNHLEKIKKNWPLTDGDTVVLAGDLSWGMNTSQSDADFAFVDALPGEKILLKGNHDYWWETQNKLKTVTAQYPSLHFLFNNTYETEECFLCGTRGWIPENTQEQDAKILRREAGRLRLSLEAWKKTGSPKPAAVFLHYPPIFSGQRCEELWQVMKDYGVSSCYYGHLHGAYAHKSAVEGTVDGITLKLISADKLDFVPWKIF